MNTAYVVKKRMIGRCTDHPLLRLSLPVPRHRHTDAMRKRNRVRYSLIEAGGPVCQEALPAFVSCPLLPFVRFPIGRASVSLDHSSQDFDPSANLGVLVRHGSLVDLREHELANRDQFVEWYGDPDIAEMLRHDLSPLSPARARSYFDSIILPASARGTCWAIHESATGQLIGSTAVTEIHADGSCLFRIVIGEKSAWGKGYGTQATALVLEQAFGPLALNQVRLEVFAHNLRAQGAYRRVGFRQTGRHAEWVATHRRQLDVLELAISREDWLTTLKA